MSILARVARRSPKGESDSTTDYSTVDAMYGSGESAPSFEALGIAPDLVAVLEQAGIQRPFPVQTLTIPDALAGRDVCGRAQTGSGKTLAFGLPLVERTTTSRRRRPQSLVLVPTRELANQVAEELAPLAAARGLWLAPIYGGASMGRQIHALQQGVDIVIGTPGRLNDLLEHDEMSVADVTCVVIDEADQMADMGFLPQVQRILDRIEGEPQTLLFSATLDGAVGALIERYQRDPVHHQVAFSEENLNGLAQRFIGVSAGDRMAVTADICAGAQRALVFVSTTHGADRLVEQLEREGIKAAAIHGRLSQSKRERTLADFSRGSVPVLVATNVAARGIHVDDIEVVIHFDPPEDHKVYVHRSGRTARAGAKGLVVTFVTPEQQWALARLQREAGLNQVIVDMRPGDERLADLVSWEPPVGDAPHPGGVYSMQMGRRAQPARRVPNRNVAPRPARGSVRQRQDFAPTRGSDRGAGYSRRGR